MKIWFDINLVQAQPHTWCQRVHWWLLIYNTCSNRIAILWLHHALKHCGSSPALIESYVIMYITSEFFSTFTPTPFWSLSSHKCKGFEEVNLINVWKQILKAVWDRLFYFHFLAITFSTLTTLGNFDFLSLQKRRDSSILKAEEGGRPCTKYNWLETLTYQVYASWRNVDSNTHHLLSPCQPMRSSSWPSFQFQATAKVRAREEVKCKSCLLLLYQFLINFTSGQVIVGGRIGFKGFNVLSSTEIFPSPHFNACSVPDMPSGRAHHTLSLLSGGRLVVCGGEGDPEVAKSCIFWTYGSTNWTHLHTIRSSRSIFCAI